MQFVIAVFLVLFIGNTTIAQPDFRFAFFTDIHLNNGGGQSHKGFQKAINHATKKKIDFILTGGDIVDVDVLDESRRNEALTLYSDFKKRLSASGKPFHITIGNNDRFWAKAGSNVTLNDDGMFKKFFERSYYSFEHKGWKFFVLNSVQSQDGVYPVINKRQVDWLKSELNNTLKNTPIIISTHVPLLSVYYPVTTGNYTNTDIVKTSMKCFNYLPAITSNWFYRATCTCLNQLTYPAKNLLRQVRFLQPGGEALIMEQKKVICR